MFHHSQTFSDFADGEPNQSGQCVRVWKDRDWQWDDNVCTNTWSYICEKQEISK